MVDAPGGSDDDVPESVRREAGYVVVREGGRVIVVMGEGGELTGLQVVAEQAVLRSDPEIAPMDQDGGYVPDA